MPAPAIRDEFRFCGGRKVVHEAVAPGQSRRVITSPREYAAHKTARRQLSPESRLNARTPVASNQSTP